MSIGEIRTMLHHHKQAQSGPSYLERQKLHHLIEEAKTELKTSPPNPIAYEQICTISTDFTRLKTRNAFNKFILFDVDIVTELESFVTENQKSEESKLKREFYHLLDSGKVHSACELLEKCPSIPKNQRFNMFRTLNALDANLMLHNLSLVRALLNKYKLRTYFLFKQLLLSLPSQSRRSAQSN